MSLLLFSRFRIVSQPALLLLVRALSRLTALLLLLARVTAGCCFSYP